MERLETYRADPGRSASAPLAVLRVFEQRHGGAVVYLYELDAPGLQFTHAYASRLIEQDGNAFVRGLFVRIERV